MENVKESNWNVHWRMTESSGLSVFLGDYKKKRVIWEASLPYVTIDHQRQEIDIEEHEPAHHGPFWTPLGTRSQASEVRKTEFRGGFELTADFQAGPYRYTQLWRFWEDGHFAPWLTIHGNGVHDGHTYHPHWRLDFDIAGSLQDSVEWYDGDKWAAVEEETWLPASAGNKDGYLWRQVGGSGGEVKLKPHSWEDAELFALRYHAAEGAPFTPRNTTGSHSFPAAYVGDEKLTDHDVTLWYVAHVHFDMAFPYTAGPMILAKP